mgnify:FL=1
MEKDKKTEKATKAIEQATHTMADTVLAVIDKLAGKESDIKLSFEDLTLDLGMVSQT